MHLIFTTSKSIISVHILSSSEGRKLISLSCRRISMIAGFTCLLPSLMTDSLCTTFMNQEILLEEIPVTASYKPCFTHRKTYPVRRETLHPRFVSIIGSLDFDDKLLCCNCYGTSEQFRLGWALVWSRKEWNFISPALGP